MTEGVWKHYFELEVTWTCRSRPRTVWRSRRLAEPQNPEAYMQIYTRGRHSAPILDGCPQFGSIQIPIAWMTDCTASRARHAAVTTRRHRALDALEAMMPRGLDILGCPWHM